MVLENAGEHHGRDGRGRDPSKRPARGKAEGEESRVERECRDEVADVEYLYVQHGGRRDRRHGDDEDGEEIAEQPPPGRADEPRDGEGSEDRGREGDCARVRGDRLTGRNDVKLAERRSERVPDGEGVQEIRIGPRAQRELPAQTLLDGKRRYVDDADAPDVHDLAVDPRGNENQEERRGRRSGAKMRAPQLSREEQMERERRREKERR